MLSPTQQRYGQHVTTAQARAVWAALTREPRATVERLHIVTGLARRTCYAAIRMLHDTGYIEAEPHLFGQPRRVIVPFYVIGKEPIDV